MIRRSLALQMLLAALSSVGAAQTAVRYTVSLADPEHHLVRITINVPPGLTDHELQLPVWNALYQVRDFSQYMNWIRAEDASAHPLPLTQLNPSRWKISGAKNGARIEYEMFSNDPGPFGTELNSHHAFFNLAEILIYIDDPHHGSQQVEFTNIPAGWKIATDLADSGTGYSATSYDELVDSPVEVSLFTESDFQGPCGAYRVVLDSPNASATVVKMVPHIQRIVAEATHWMNDCPFHTYTFIYHFSDSGGGGMEHAYSTAITLRPRSLEGDMGTFDYITAHEFFHLWDVKRIRPQSLAPVDYTKANYSAALWFSEGVDSTAAECILLRAGLLDEKRYLNSLGSSITDLQNEAAHFTQSVEQSSLDAWLEKYPYYNLQDRSISYYNKGELLGVLLDLRMRTMSHDRASIRTLFRWMNEHYAKQGKFFDDSIGVRAAAEQASRADLSNFFRDYVSGTAEIPWNDFFTSVGLRLESREEALADPGFEAHANFNQGLTVVRVVPGREADRAGLKSGDVILQVNGNAAGRNVEKDINELGPGGLMRLHIRRDGEERDVQFVLGSRNETVFTLEDVPGISTEQKRHRELWLFDRDDRGVEPKPSPASATMPARAQDVRSRGDSVTQLSSPQ